MRAEISPGVEIEYIRAGQGPAVVFLHAFPLSNQMWAGQFRELENQFNCIAPNTRGFSGSTPFDSPAAIQQIAQDTDALLTALGVNEPIVLCGLSMGGYVAQRFAHDYSHRLRGLILCDTRAEPDSPEAREKRNDNIAHVRSQGTAALVERLIPGLLGETTRRDNPALVEQIREWGNSQPVETLVAALEALRDRPDTTEWLAHIKVPTLLLFGTEDALAPAEAIQKLDETIPDSKLVKITGAGHLPNLEQPAAYNRALVEFLHSLA